MDILFGSSLFGFLVVLAGIIGIGTFIAYLAGTLDDTQGTLIPGIWWVSESTSNALPALPEQSSFSVVEVVRAPAPSPAMVIQEQITNDSALCWVHLIPLSQCGCYAHKEDL